MPLNSSSQQVLPLLVKTAARANEPPILRPEGQIIIFDPRHFFGRSFPSMLHLTLEVFEEPWWRCTNRYEKYYFDPIHFFGPCLPLSQKCCSRIMIRALPSFGPWRWCTATSKLIAHRHQDFLMALSGVRANARRSLSSNDHGALRSWTIFFAQELLLELINRKN